MCLGAFTKNPEFKCVVCGKPAQDHDLCAKHEAETKDEGAENL